MKKLNLIIAGFAFFAIFSVVSCASGDGAGNDSKDTTIVQLEEKMNSIESGGSDSLKSANEVHDLGKEYTAKYICPNHCKGSGSDKEGTCAGCGMDLMENPNHQQK
jgi:ABC-type phosphate transport system substrate-binding protein